MGTLNKTINIMFEDINSKISDIRKLILYNSKLCIKCGLYERMESCCDDYESIYCRDCYIGTGTSCDDCKGPACDSCARTRIGRCMQELTICKSCATD